MIFTILLLISACSKNSKIEKSGLQIIPKVSSKSEEIVKSYGLKTIETILTYNKEKISRIVEMDRDNDGKYEEYIQIFYKNNDTFLSMSKMKSKEGFQYLPKYKILVAKYDFENKNYLQIIDKENKTFLLLEEEENGCFKKVDLEIAKKFIDLYTDFNDVLKK